MLGFRVPLFGAHSCLSRAVIFYVCGVLLQAKHLLRFYERFALLDANGRELLDRCARVRVRVRACGVRACVRAGEGAGTAACVCVSRGRQGGVREKAGGMGGGGGV